MTPDSLDIWAPSGEHIVVAWDWQFERLLGETKKTLNKAEEDSSISLSCRLTDSRSTYSQTILSAQSHEISRLDQESCILEHKTNCCTPDLLIQNLKTTQKKKNIIQVIQIIRNVQSNGSHHTLSSLQYISRIGRNCWKEQMWTHARFLQATMPNCQLRWPNFIKDRNSNIQLHSSLPGSMVGNLPVTILLELSFKVKKKQTNKQTQYVPFTGQISSDFLDKKKSKT